MSNITTLKTHRISTCATDTDVNIESKVGDNILLLRLSDNGSVLLLSKYKVDIDSFVFTLSLCFIPLIWLSRLEFTIFPTSTSFIKGLQFALNGCPVTFEIHDLHFSICKQSSWKDVFDLLYIFILLEMKLALRHSFKLQILLRKHSVQFLSFFSRNWSRMPKH